MAEFENVQPGSDEYVREQRRRALENMKRLGKKGVKGRRTKPIEEEKPLGPGANDELWPGGPDAYGNRPEDFRVASARRVAIAKIRQGVA